MIDDVPDKTLRQLHREQLRRMARASFLSPVRTRMRDERRRRWRIEAAAPEIIAAWMFCQHRQDVEAKYGLSKPELTDLIQRHATAEQKLERQRRFTSKRDRERIKRRTGKTHINRKDTRCPVVVHGVVYPSIIEASKATGIRYGTIHQAERRRRLRSGAA